MAETPHVHLIPLDADALTNLRDAPTAFASKTGVEIGDTADLLQEVAEQTMALLERVPRPEPWGAYLATDEEGRHAAGTCAFKDAPAGDGSVEIAYFTFPPYEGHGYATAMTEAMIDVARASGQAQRLVALTLPEMNASTRVLEKCGFRLAGGAVDPEDGPVWRWELPLAG